MRIRDRNHFAFLSSGRAHRSPRLVGAVAALALVGIAGGISADALGAGTGATGPGHDALTATAGGKGPIVTVNGNPLMGGDNTRLPGCSMEVAVTGLPADSAHTIGVNVAAMDPSGAGPVLTVTEPDVVGSFTTGSRNLAATLYDGGFRKAGNGYHLRVSVSVDGTSVGAAPFWLACGAVQHGGHAVQVQFAVHWVAADGQLLTSPPKGLTTYKLTASSPQARATCRYGSGTTLVCTYVSTEESTTEPPPVGLHVSGLGTFTVEEHGLPSRWAPELNTVGQFVGDPALRQWFGGGGEDEAGAVQPLMAAGAGGPPVIIHTVINREAR